MNQVASESGQPTASEATDAARDTAQPPQVLADGTPPEPRVVFLFGAGASFGAGGILPEAPPLGAQLYDALARVHPGTWGSLPPAMKAAFRVEFEGGMVLVYRDLGAAIPELMREMAIYFIQFRSHEGASLYDRLIEDALSQGYASSIAFATLNYECVLEFALLSHGLSLDYFGLGLEAKIPVWKLHGSANMFCKDLQVGIDVSYTPGVVWEGGIQATLDTSEAIARCFSTGLAPVMCLYMAGKPLAVSPSSLRAVQDRWAQAVAVAPAIICVGIRPNPADDHIWKPLAAAPGPVYFVGDEEPFKAWASENRAGPATILGRGFGPSFPHIIRKAREHATQSV